MRGKILFATGLAVGYVLGTRAGRERYEELKRVMNGFWGDPRVQRRVDQVEDFVKDKAPEVAEFVSDGAKKVVNQVMGHRSTSQKSGASSASASAAKKPASTAAAKKSAVKRSSAASSGSSS